MSSHPKIHLTLMRHGRSRADDEKVHEGRYDSPLTEVGQQQAQQRAENWLARGITFDVIIASSLQRAHSTAQIVAEALKTPLEIDPDWMEFNNGPLAGLSRDEANRLYPLPDFRNPYERFWGSGESELGFHTRIAGALERLMQRGAGRYLVVAHGGSLNAALRIMAGSPPPIHLAGMWYAFGDTATASLDYYPHAHQWVLHQLNCGI